VPGWYRSLIYQACLYAATTAGTNATPKLELAPKPYSCEIEVDDEVLDSVIEGQLEDGEELV
jgi:hypothetical protein